jgi:hypothetical protein
MKFDIALAKGSAEAASPLIGLCYNRAHQLEGRFVTEAYELDGCTAILKVRGDSSVAIISCGDSGAVLHPRTGAVELLSYTEYLNQFGLNIPVPKKTIWGVKGGWLNGTTNYDTANIYPIDDGDNASFGLGEERVLVGEFLQDEGNYGNLYWWNGNTEEPDFLSWKGTPTRHFRVPNNIEIPGISTQETTLPSSGGEDTPIFTTFSHYVYSGGVVLETAPAYNWPNAGPPLAYVLGAARDSEGVIYIVTQSDRFNVPLYIAAFSDGTIVQNDTGQGVDPPSGVDRVFYKTYSRKRGIYTQLWKQGTQYQGWDLVWEEETSRQGLPWFADTEGSYFVNPLGTKITVQGTKSTLGIEGSGNFKITATPVDNVVSICSNGKFESTYTNDALFEPEGNGSINLSFSTLTTKVYEESKTKVYNGTFDMIYDPDDPTQVPQPLRYEHSIYTTQQAVAGQLFISGFTGGEGNYVYTYNGFSVNSSGVITSVGCGMGSVSVVDACGDTISRPIRLSGVWMVTGNYTSGSTPMQGGGFSCLAVETINEESRTITTWCNFANTSVSGYINGCTLSCSGGGTFGVNCYASVTFPTGAANSVGDAPSSIVCQVNAGFPYKALAYGVQVSTWVCP